jgi:ABC-2 type transport system ATP-binding protein
LFLDEPTIGLDVTMQTKIRQFIAEYNRRHNATILLTSHYMADVTALCKRVLVIDHGKLMYDGLLDDLSARIAPHKLIRVELASALNGHPLSDYGEVRKAKGQRVEFLVPRSKTSETASRILSELPVADVTIEDPPIEDVITRVFEEAALARKETKESDDDNTWDGEDE